MIQVMDMNGWLMEVESEDELFDLAQEMADDNNMWGGWIIEDNQIVGDCDGEICDVCDGHIIGIFRKV